MTHIIKDNFERIHNAGVCKKPDPWCPYCISEVVGELCEEYGVEPVMDRIKECIRGGLDYDDAVMMLLDEKNLQTPGGQQNHHATKSVGE